MSKLEVDKVTPQSGTTLTIGEAGDTTVINGLGTLPATIGSATQVLAVNAGATGLEYGTAATDLSNLNATNLTSGTVPDGRFPSVLPAAGAQNLTSLQPAAIVGGTFGSINAANLTNLNATALTSGTIPAARISSLPAGVGGKVLQVQNMTSTSATSTTSSSFVATALTDTITPSATSSKILILATGNLNNTSGSQWTYATIAKGGTNLGAAQGMTGIYASGDNHSACTMTYLDSPSSTSELTYDVRISVSGGTGKWNQQSAKISLTLIEIGA